MHADSELQFPKIIIVSWLCSETNHIQEKYIYAGRNIFRML